MDTKIVTPLMQPYVYEGKVVYVHEGNLFDVVLDMGFRLTNLVKFWLRGFYLPFSKSDISATEKALFHRSKDFAFCHFLRRSVIVAPVSQARQSRGIWYADIYLKGEDAMFPEATVQIGMHKYIDLKPYMELQHSLGYDQSKVHIKYGT